ncbi:hypothetical protein QTG54_006440 [Skeletonema marinoi]|uniref:Uncharacterized protein n=1 Tax=Skeletonema marinoi TaxID=267567 RepID=A0AAD9DEL5_9STRA|nr:hypothetical protein QTG54_006440 [Skeletonema marinoi]
MCRLIDHLEAWARAINAGTEWATSQVFDALKPRDDKLCFDDFADWYQGRMSKYTLVGIARFAQVGAPV